MKGISSAGLKRGENCFGRISSKRQDYRRYNWKRGEFGAAALLSAAVTGFLAYFFYRSVWAIAPLSLVGAVFFYRMREEKGKKERMELAEQFRECILSAAASLQAGYSVENAFVECGQDMMLMYGQDALICKELRLIQRGLHINFSLEELLADLGERSGCEEIVQFAEVFSIAKKSGGDLSEIISASAGLIGRKIELRKEIGVLLGGKKMELAIMKAMPFAILLYIDLANQGYFDILYHNLRGILIMTGCLAAYLGAYVMSESILRRMEEGLL